ncbi:restriction endonuclease subunit S [Crenobacter cavernae]|uniref:Restriction endonuclease subunit S n=1 Tax=Crenobacter cavernae TaxID=2290923 RepID=A0A345Y225_9NEIS|nr:restriction endonuclease subunit S [Crenobacter cavernae]AXK37977.1 restriction endonuclease subunit S [Crenobacter cavernae]
MSSEWPTVQLGDCTELVTGFPFKSAQYSESPDAIRLLRGDNIGQGVLRWDGVKRWPQQASQELGGYDLRESDIVLAMDRPWIPAGLKFARVRKSDLPSLLVQRVARLRPMDCIRADYLYCVIASREFTEYIQNVTTGTAVPHISAKQIREFKFKLPDLGTQVLVGQFLANLDDRIALLRETNATQEAIAQALFKSWFVDFDPVRAKQEGRAPEGMDEATAALFPDEFEESELGLVPRGWKPIRLDSFIELAYGKALKAENRNPGKVPVYGSGGITGWHDTALVSQASIIVGRKGTVGSIYWESRPFFPIDTVFYVKAQRPLTYCHQLLKTLGLHDMNTDAAVPGLNRENVYRLLVPDASLSVINAFDEVVKGLRQAIDHNEYQAQTLATLRDTLLPRLISGQLRLPEAESEAT